MSKDDQLLCTIEESFEGNFTTFHNCLFLLGLSNDAIVLYLRLKSMAYGKKTASFPSVRTLALQVGVTDRTIQRWMKELIDRGVITRIEQFDQETKMQTNNQYTIRDISKIYLSSNDNHRKGKSMYFLCSGKMEHSENQFNIVKVTKKKKSHYKIRKRLREMIIERDNSTCVYCGKKLEHPCLDHIIPRSKGGVNTVDNLACACNLCNSSKGSKMLNEWKGH